MRLSVVFVLIVSFLVPVLSCAQTDMIESVSRQYADSHPGLESYRVKLKTNKIDEMLARMTANMPQDVPRPERPELMKFWNRKSGTVIRSMTTTSFPYMQQMINRFSQRFAVDLGSLFLPADQTAERGKLLKNAVVKSAEAQIADKKIHHLEIAFKKPTDVAGAFYGTSLDLPQRQINKLALDIDPEKSTLVQLEIEADGQQKLLVEIRHLDIKDNNLPSEVTITSPDGSIEEKFTTTFKLIDGYHLPIRQERQIRRPGLDEELLVEFSDYQLVKK
jgi:hypothetical protein